MGKIKLEKIDEYRWLIPREGNMRVPGLIFADEILLKQVQVEETGMQIKNAAHLPGILKYSMAMPDVHWGYGLPIGGVVGVDVEEGVISPGGVGYDINCGVRMVKTNLIASEVINHLKSLVNNLFSSIPCGVGRGGKLKISKSDERKVLIEGSSWAVKEGFGWQDDINATEDFGKMDGANPDNLSKRALERGRDQLGTLGSGNHFLEIQKVVEIYDEKKASHLGLFREQVCIMIHSGSRGLGYQVCDDYLSLMGSVMGKYKIELPDRQLACAPIKSPEGQRYLSAMRGAANYAWANRQIIMHWVREVFEKFFNRSAENLGMNLLYDNTHNIAKIEKHNIDGKMKTICIHRKGATRSYPENHYLVPDIYKKIGLPVIIPGDMGRASYVMVGGKKAVEHSFGSTCHGAGRVLSRRQAVKEMKGRAIGRELEDRGIFVRSIGRNTLKEEASEAYKDIDHVVEVVHKAGLSEKVAKLVPLGVIKG
ncbi:RNA-splicing ligase RtcB [candidate division KSB1 bacterium]|nr:MAG: RNA-splicing ligase RtcB [candidate division KSB1 bacterium]